MTLRSFGGMDYQTAWDFVRCTKFDDHHPRCSWRQTNRAILCDCDVLWNEHVRRGGHDPRTRDLTPGPEERDA